MSPESNIGLQQPRPPMEPDFFNEQTAPVVIPNIEELPALEAIETRQAFDEVVNGIEEVVTPEHKEELDFITSRKPGGSGDIMYSPNPRPKPEPKPEPSEPAEPQEEPKPEPKRG